MCIFLWLPEGFRKPLLHREGMCLQPPDYLVMMNMFHSAHYDFFFLCCSKMCRKLLQSLAGFTWLVKCF